MCVSECRPSFFYIMMKTQHICSLGITKRTLTTQKGSRNQAYTVTVFLYLPSPFNKHQSCNQPEAEGLFSLGPRARCSPILHQILLNRAQQVISVSATLTQAESHPRPETARQHPAGKSVEIDKEVSHTSPPYRLR